MTMSEKDISLLGKDLSPKETQEVKKAVQDWRIEMWKKVAGEIEKPAEMLWFIERLNDFLTQEFSELGPECIAHKWYN